MNVCRYHQHWRIDSIDPIIIHHMIESSIETQCHDKIMKSKYATTYKCQIQVVVIYWII